MIASNPVYRCATFIEVTLGSNDSEPAKALRGFLASFEILFLSPEVATEAVSIRSDLQLKIPDAIVNATARTQGCIPVSRNTQDLKPEWPDIRIPYQM